MEMSCISGKYLTFRPEREEKKEAEKWKELPTTNLELSISLTLPTFFCIFIKTMNTTYQQQSV